ncbi:MAG TPA: DUF4303 domain-containing protein [Tepidisphaeraceae bacterium]|nr:DUF4303 domain-containing protein [Tepidisphaeraceae bacterium]
MSTDARVIQVLKEAATKAFSDLRAAHSGEQFYAFALYTDDDAAGIAPAANTEGALAERLAQYKFKNPLDVLSVRWNTGEWKFAMVGAEHFGPSDALLAEVEKAAGTFKKYRQRVFDAMIGALAALDREGFFGVGADRERATLLCAVTDADKAGEQFSERSIRELNPPSVIAAYEDAWKKAESAPRVDGGPPCPKCGQPLRTAKAQQCFKCGAKWHGQSAPK